MTVIRSARDPEFLVDYSTLVVRDSGPGTGVDDVRLSEDLATLSVTGRLAMAGQGWLHAHTRAEYLDVVLEVHDAPPAPEPTAQGVALMETPYLSPSGEVTLDSLVPMAGSTVLELDGPGLYRVRVNKEPGPDGERWRLSFWRQVGDPEPPRWWALEAAPDGSATTERSWRSVLPYEAVELLQPLQAERDGALTLEQLVQFWRRHGRGGEYLDDVLLPERSPCTTGFPDLDASLAESHSKYDDERRATWASLSQQLGIALPRTRGDLLGLLVAAGLLTCDESGVYALVENPPHPRELLDIPQQQLGREDRREQERLHGDLAADVERVVLWSPGRRHPTSLRDLAERLLTKPAPLRAALAHGERSQHLVVDRDARSHDEPLILTLPDQTPSHAEDSYDEPAVRFVVDDEPVLAFEEAYDEPAHVAMHIEGTALRREEALREGPPPRWGVLVDGQLWRWGDGRASVVPLDDPFCEQALHTRFGTLLLHVTSARLVDDDGHVHDLGRLAPVALDRDARWLAGVEARYGRRRSTFRLHAVDLSTRDRVTMPWPATRQIREVAVDDVDGSITFRAEPDPDDPASDDALHRWRPGHAPVVEPAAEGTPGRHGLRTRWDDTGLHLTWPTGTRQHYRVDGRVRPAPIAPMLYSLRSDPPAVAIWALQEGAVVEARILMLPEGARPHDSGPGKPVWESSSSLLLTVSPYARLDEARALRLDVHTGAVERVDVPAGDGMGIDQLTFVEGPPGASVVVRQPRRSSITDTTTP